MSYIIKQSKTHKPENKKTKTNNGTLSPKTHKKLFLKEKKNIQTHQTRTSLSINTNKNLNQNK